LVVVRLTEQEERASVRWWTMTSTTGGRSWSKMKGMCFPNDPS
jgi:hypothetical protein